MNIKPTIPLISGIIAAIGASLCCTGPLIFLLLGVSGSWVSRLTVLEPYRPIFLLVVIVTFFFASKRVFRPIEACSQNSVCANPKTRRWQKVILLLSSIVALIFVATPYWIPLFA
ncbi:mercuric transporter MerT family protein [Enterovibrio nigricans]|uniref:mercuric transporter MerT family protein n=1 Tax=Enterovibrio nigricans TaxID=504469 RepID=UPI00099990D1|nr:mercuric transporter MerT family protein [Enterovibrio nigricans]PKF49939.1 mercury transporter [Enterovibrio nigricans]